MGDSIVTNMKRRTLLKGSLAAGAVSMAAAVQKRERATAAIAFGDPLGAGAGLLRATSRYRGGGPGHGGA